MPDSPRAHPVPLLPDLLGSSPKLASEYQPRRYICLDAFNLSTYFSGWISASSPAQSRSPAGWLVEVQ